MFCALFTFLAATALATPTVREGWPVDHGCEQTTVFMQANPVNAVVLPNGDRRVLTTDADSMMVYDIDGNEIAAISAAGLVTETSMVRWFCAGPNVGDIDGDGEYEFVMGIRQHVGRKYAFMGFEMDGTPVTGCKHVWDALDFVNTSSFVLANVDDDEADEIIIGIDSLYAFNGDGTIVDGFPWAYDEGFVADWISSPAVIPADDTHQAIIVYPSMNRESTVQSRIYAREVGQESLLDGWPVMHARIGFLMGPTIVPTENGFNTIVGGGEGVYCWDQAGTLLNGFPTTLPDVTQITHMSITDVDGDGSLEVVCKGNTGSIHALQFDGTQVLGYPHVFIDYPSSWRETIAAIRPGAQEPACLFMGYSSESVNSSCYGAFQNRVQMEGFPLTFTTLETAPRMVTAIFPPQDGTLQVVSTTEVGFTTVIDVPFDHEYYVLDWAMPYGDTHGNRFYAPIAPEAPPAPAFEFSTTTLEFGQLGPDETATQQFTVTNSGDADGELTTVVADAAIAAQLEISGTYPMTVAAGGSVTVDVVWTPAAEGDLTGNITVTHNGNVDDGETVLALTGNYNDVRDQQNVPTDYFLAQNYPNPFNPTTSISFGLKETGAVKLTVYNINGQVVRTLVNKQLPAGSHNVVFAAEGLASGVYYYAIDVNGYRDLKKMIFIQ